MSKKEEKKDEVVQPSAPTAQILEKQPEQKELTPEQQRQANAQILQITLYPDGILQVASVQNINTRAMAEYLINRAKDDYFKADIANMTAMKLIDMITKSQADKKKTGGLWTGKGK